MKSPEIYREHAASARRLASRSGNEEEHACLLALARQWQREADLLEERQAAPLRPVSGGPSEGVRVDRGAG
jgi:hypothetical protein